MMEALVTIRTFATQPGQKESIGKHASMILNMARESFTEPNDLKDLEERSKKLSGRVGG